MTRIGKLRVALLGVAALMGINAIAWWIASSPAAPKSTVATFIGMLLETTYCEAGETPDNNICKTSGLPPTHVEIRLLTGEATAPNASFKCTNPESYSQNLFELVIDGKLRQHIPINVLTGLQVKRLAEVFCPVDANAASSK